MILDLEAIAVRRAEEQLAGIDWSTLGDGRSAHCCVEGCPILADAKGMCRRHYRLARARALGVRPKPEPEPVLCSVCGHTAKARGLCQTHYTAWRRERIRAGLLEGNP